VTTAGTPFRRIIKRNGTQVEYDRGRIETAIYKATLSLGAADRSLAAALAQKVERALVSAYAPPSVPSVEDIQDVVEQVLVEDRRTALAREYIIYRHQRAMLRASRGREFEVSDNIPYRKIYEVLRWNMDHGCDSVANLNRLIRRGQFGDLVRESDRRYSEEVAFAGQGLIERRADVRVAIVSGPSSSGKTTTTLKLSETLASAGLKLKWINIDHYFFELASHPRDEFGDYDYETPQAVDLELVNAHLADLLAGREVRTPHYDFKTGRRRLEAHPLRLEENEILLIDSLHGLHGEMTRSVPDACKYRIYVETLGQLRAADGSFMRWADNRLLRRMHRDKDHRNLQPLETLTHWHYVRRSELKHIIPLIKRADAVINTALPYEMPIWRRRLLGVVARALRTHAHDPRRLDAHIRANRVHQLLKPLRPVADESAIPPDSLLREFIGGSRYRY
jgi:uridine kinase